jgi:hypothetical protein
MLSATVSSLNRTVRTACHARTPCSPCYSEVKQCVVKYCSDVGILSEDEARRIADQLLHDIANAVDVDAAVNIYGLFAQDGRDAMAIGLKLLPALTNAINRYKIGDRSPQTLNLVAAGKLYIDEQHLREIEANANRRRDARERREAATLPTPPPEVAALLCDRSDLLGIPLPADAVLLEQSDTVRRYSTKVTTVMELSAAYQHQMIADGWTYDRRCSKVDADRNLLRHKWYHTSQVFLRPTSPVQCVNIIVESRDEVSYLHIQELFDEEMPEA